MGKKTKQGKGRQDKYYYLAKEQGYRSRAAFKLVQLNKKYGFLGNARVCIDLCAAPGGWLQVAAKYMPVSSVIVGVDLVPIRPIRNVQTIADDITTESCRHKLKDSLKGWQADVVLHDGAPNVGKAWLHDAYSQSELTLHSLRLATEFLIRGGTFVTKVFRSAEYNSLLYVFNQLFRRVEATKPTASRNTSAEIYVICRGFLAPKHIDPRLLDPRTAFAEILPQINSAAALFKKRAKPNQMGYTHDGPVFQKITLAQFVETDTPVQALAENFQLVFDDDASKHYADDPIFQEPVRVLCEDLHVLSKHEFKKLLRVREYLRKKYPTAGDIAKEAEKKKEAEEQAQAEALNSDEEEALRDQQLADDIAATEKQSRRQRKKANKKRTRTHDRMTLEMHHQVDVRDYGANYDPEETFRLADIPDQSVLDHLTHTTLMPKHKDTDVVVSSEDESDYDFEKDADKFLNHTYAAELEDQLDFQYRRYCAMRKKKVPLPAAPAGMKLKEKPKPEVEVWDAVQSSLQSQAQSDDRYQTTATSKNPLLVRANKIAPTSGAAVVSNWFSQDLFQNLLNPASSGLSDKADNQHLTDLQRKALQDAQIKQKLIQEFNEESDSSSGDERQKAREARRKKREREFEKEAFQIVPISDSDSDDDRLAQPDYSDDDDDDLEEDVVDDEDKSSSSDSDYEYDVDAAIEVLAYAKGILRQHGKIDPSKIVDDSYNRWAQPDNEIRPTWFSADHAEHEKPQLPLKKEDLMEIKARAKAVDARPIKKIAEAAGRKRRRMQAKLKKLKEQAQQIANSGDMNDREKMRAVERMAARALNKKSTSTEKFYVVKTKATAKSKIPKAPTGNARVHCVDKRMKADRKNERTRLRKARVHVKKPRKK